MDRLEAARAMGMKLSEVVDLEQTADGVVVTTHDGIRTLLPGPAAKVVELNTGGEWTDITAYVSDQEPAGDEVPDGTAKDVLAWVGDDQERALRALVAEEGKESPRKVLVKDLEKLVAQS